jgi:hypothetical protein
MTTVELRYQGEKISAQQGMVAYDVAESIDGFADFLDSLTKAAYGPDVQTRLLVRTARPGSFDIQFVYEVAGAAYTIMAATGPASILELINQSFELLKHLKGEPPKSTKTADRGSIFVENNDGKIIVVNQPIFQAVVDGRASDGTAKFARRPLQSEADEIDVTVDGELAAKANP